MKDRTTFDIYDALVNFISDKVRIELKITSTFLQI